jgi:hypothetical protein
MKKVITTMTALAFVLGLTASGFAQTTGIKEGDKTAVKPQATATAPQAAPVDKDKGKVQEVGKLPAKETEAKDKKPETLVTTKDNSKKPVVPAPETKKVEPKGTAK